MPLALLSDQPFFFMLFAIDQAWANLAGEGRCPACGGPLHKANYPRKPRGGPPGSESCLNIRFSFCCGREGCRKRFTPPSVRFMGRKVYLAAVVILQPANSFVPTRTLASWRAWWREHVAPGSFWKEAKGLLVAVLSQAGDPSIDDPPATLLHRFRGDLASRLVSTLRFLCPLSTLTQFYADDYLRLDPFPQKNEMG